MYRFMLIKLAGAELPDKDELTCKLTSYPGITQQFTNTMQFACRHYDSAAVRERQNISRFYWPSVIRSMPSAFAVAVRQAGDTKLL